MKQRLAFLSLVSLVALAASPLAAQANTVPGLDGRLTVIDNMTYYGRQGAAHPNGEIGMAMLNTMCNPGSIPIPWFQAMQPDHPKFGFTVVRVTGERIVQINDYRSFCKHAFLSINVNGSCGSCINPPAGGAQMGLNCSDTYAPGNNASRTWLGPAWEINPWTGVWDPVGSYFDVGHPNQPGYPLPADGNRSLNYNFNSVENRLTVKEQDMLVAGANYYYGLQLIHEGEALGNRGDNLAHRGFDPTWNGSSWSFPTNIAGQEFGTVLDRWPGASVEVGTNGTDDGRIYVASKVTPLGGGMYHYEYAVHNVDSSRGIRSFRLPIDAGATASNFTFRDVDSDGGNQWTWQRVGNELVCEDGGGSNVQDWNMIFNFGFDADVPPGTSDCALEAARPGAGAMATDVRTEIPGTSTIASFETFGQGCPVSQPNPFGTCWQANAAGGGLTNRTSTDQLAYKVSTTLPSTLASFRIFTRSTIGPQTVDAYVFDNVAGLPGATPVATTQITIGAQPAFYEAVLSTPVQVAAGFFVAIDDDASTIVYSDIIGGQQLTLAYSRAGNGPWSLELPLVYGGITVDCATGPLFDVPAVAVSALPAIGTTYDVELSDALPSSAAVLIHGVSNTVSNGLPLPAPLPGAPGCQLLVSTDSLQAALLDPSGSASLPFVVPNNPAVVGFIVHHQWAIVDAAANSLGVITSNAGTARIGN